MAKILFVCYGAQKLNAAHPVNYFPGVLGKNIENCPPSKLFLFTSIYYMFYILHHVLRLLQLKDGKKKHCKHENIL